MLLMFLWLLASHVRKPNLILIMSAKRATTTTRNAMRKGAKWHRKSLVEKWAKPKDRFERWKIIRGDKVEVISGVSKGQRGVVKKVFRKENRMLVGGCNLVKKRMPAQEGQPGGSLVTKEAPIPYSNLALIDPSTDQPCRIRWQETPDGTVRVSVKSGAIIERPAVLTRLRNYPKIVSPKDTSADVAHEKTFDDITGLVPQPNFWKKQFDETEEKK